MVNASDFSWEGWIHGRIKKELAADPALSGAAGFEPRARNHLSRNGIDTYQVLMLRRVLAYVSRTSSFYRKFLNQHQVRIDEIRTLSDMKRLPMVEPEILTRCPEKLLCVSLSKIGRVFTFTTSGTIGNKKRVFFTTTDLENIIGFFSAAAHAMMRYGNVFQVLLPGGRYMDQADLLRRGIEKAGGKTVMANGTLTAAEQLKTIERNHSRIIIATVSCLNRLSEQARSYPRLKDTGVKALVATSEHLPDVLRKRCQSLWNCEVYSHYGLTEMGLGFSLECSAHQGFHVNEADFIVEVADPVTGEVLPDGEEGELIITTLRREGMPLVRYRTHDIGRVVTGGCACGAQNLKRICGIKGRSEKKISLEGIELHSAQFDECILAVPGVINYEIVFPGNAAFKIRIETERDRKRVEAQVKKALRKMVISQTGSTPKSPPVPEIEIFSGNLSCNFI